ncbi:MAG: hypothetical protein KF729_15030 [Sandaracinaceae bacterium]|nr:hypothetical protein [Sandaracinaceae bacterium]
MLDDRRIELWIGDLTGRGGDALDRAREVFHQRTGAFEVGDPWYEERIRAFFEWYLCDHGGAERWLEAQARPSPEDRALARACARSARSLYTVREVGADGATLALDDRLCGGRFEVLGPALAVGDTFDGRILALDALHLSPGLVFHPPETHEPLAALLDAITPLDGDRAPILDGLLRMRMRLDRFTSIRAKHLYRVEALHDRDILSAGWARRG